MLTRGMAEVAKLLSESFDIEGTPPEKALTERDQAAPVEPLSPEEQELEPVTEIEAESKPVAEIEAEPEQVTEVEGPDQPEVEDVVKTATRGIYRYPWQLSGGSYEGIIEATEAGQRDGFYVNVSRNLGRAIQVGGLLLWPAVSAGYASMSYHERDSDGNALLREQGSALYANLEVHLTWEKKNYGVAVFAGFGPANGNYEKSRRIDSQGEYEIEDERSGIAPVLTVGIQLGIKLPALPALVIAARRFSTQHFTGHAEGGELLSKSKLFIGFSIRL